jgi:transcription antitermination factor NusG
MWYAVYTRPRWEKKVANLLMRKNIESYCPLNRVKKQWHDRKKIVEVPLFTSYVFIKADNSSSTSILETDGILNFVHWLGKRAIIRDSEIQTIKDFLLEYDNIQLEKKRININDRVKIIEGPLTDISGTVKYISGRTVYVELPSLGYAMKAQVQLENVEKIIMEVTETETKGNIYSKIVA